MRGQGVSKSSRTNPAPARQSHRNGDDIPAGFGRRITSKFNRISNSDHDIVSGVDLLTGTLGGAPTGTPATHFRVPCSPSFWTNTRVAAESRLFGIYTPRKIVVHWQPAVGTTTAGAIIMGTVGVANNFVGSSTSTALLASHGSVVSSIWRDCSCSMDLSGLTQKAYNLNDITEDGVPMNIYVQIPNITVAAGYLWVEYVFEFRLSQSMQAESALYSMLPTSMQLVNANTNQIISDGIGIGEAGVIVCNCVNSNIANMYYEVGLTNMVVDFGRVGTRLDITMGPGANSAQVYDGENLLFGKGGVNTSIYTARPAGGAQ